MTTNFIQPNWPAPPQVKAYCSLRASKIGERQDANIAFGDVNRTLLKKTLDLPDNPILVNQTHSTIAIAARQENQGKEADALFTSQPNQICTILTADCLPVLVCDKSGQHVAAIHAGWRGLANGIIEKTLSHLNIPPAETLIWLGPAIGPTRFEVRKDVYDIFTQHDSQAAEAFQPINAEQWLGNLYTLARQRLGKLGIKNIYGGDLCTYTDQTLFYSYRREGSAVGRIASLIWLSTND